MLLAQLAQQAIGYHHGPQSPEKYDEKPTNIVFAKNGVFRVNKTAVGVFKSKIGEYAKDVDLPGVEAMSPEPELLIPKIPFKYIQQVLSFYRAVHRQDKTEASALFFWNENDVELPPTYTDNSPIRGLHVDGRLIIYVPRQKNSSGLSEFHGDAMVNWLREHTALLCETHSHHTMDAFWSGTDNANENATQFYGVWGHIFTQNPKFLFRYVCGETKENISPATLFDWPMRTITTTMEIEIPGQEKQVERVVEQEIHLGAIEDCEFPDDWMGQHSKSTVVPLSSYNRTGGTGAGTGYGRGGAGYGGGYGAGYGYGDYGYPYNGYQQEEDDLGHTPGKFANRLETKSETSVPEVTRVPMEKAEVVAVKEESDIRNFRASAGEARAVVEELAHQGYTTVVEQVIDQNQK